MKRSVRAVLATSAALALTGLGVAPAAATEAPPKHPDPAWEKVDDRYYFPAGSACADKIKIHEKFKYRFTVLKESKHSAKYKEELHHGYAKFYNPKTHKWVKIPIHDTTYIHENRTKATAVAKGKGVGYLQGPGIRGIAFLQGKVTVKVTGLDNFDHLNFDIKKVHGTYKQLCYKLGSKPVEGKLVIPPSESSTT